MDSYGFKNDKTKSEQTIENMISSAVSAAVTNLQAQINGVWNKIYPIGSIYYTTNSTNPSVLFGGTWESYGIGRVLVGYDPNDASFNVINRRGGERNISYTPSGTVGSHALTVNEMAAHTHYENADVDYAQSGDDIPVFKFDVGGQLYTKGIRTDGSVGQSHTHSFAGTPVNIGTLQPYQVVRIWRRTA